MDRYLLGEMVMPFLGGILLIIVMLIGNTLFPLIQPIVKNGIPLKVVAKLVVFNIPTLLVLTLPAGMALSAAWAVNRMARDSEITAIRMAGVPLRRIFLPIFGMGVVTSAAAFLIGDRVVPAAQHQFQETQGQMLAYAIQASPALAANKVFTYQNYSFHIHEIQKDSSGDPNKLKLSGVTIYENPSDDGYPVLMTARSADYNKDIWTLHDVVMHSIGPDGFTRLEIAGETTTLNLRVPLNLAAGDYLRPDELTMRQLGQQMAALARTHQDFTEVAVNYYMKLSLPLICLAFAFCAPPLALRFSRAGAYMGIFLSLVMVWVAWNTLLLTKFLGLSGKLDPMIAAWSPDVLFAVIGAWLLWKAE
jgi:LPS export ABC transporter permease LptG